MEAYGCAHITTGLIHPENLDKALSNNLSWTLNYLVIFHRQLHNISIAAQQTTDRIGEVAQNSNETTLMAHGLEKYVELLN